MDFSKEITFTTLGTVDMQDFYSALGEVKPTFGMDEDKIGQRLRGKFVNYGNRFEEIHSSVSSAIQTFSESNLGISSLLLFGQNGCGKTTLACQLATESKIPYTKILSSEDLIGRADYGKIKFITETFNNAYRSPVSLIIIDEIER